MQSLRSFLLWTATFMIVAFLVAPTTSAAFASDEEYRIPPGVSLEVALGGLDLTSYYKNSSGPQKGNPEIFADHDGYRYYFATEQNKNTFLSNPDYLAPVFGHTCAFALGEGRPMKADPTIFLTQGNKLYLFSETWKRDAWAKDPDTRLKLASKNWDERKNTISDFQIKIGKKN